MNEKSQDVAAILKLYELRREPEMRRARAWYFTEFRPTSGKDVVRLDLSGERESANFRMVTSFWDMACSFVLGGAIDEKLFLNANTEHILVYAAIAPHLVEVRQLFNEPDYLENLEKLVTSLPNIHAKLENRRKLMEKWALKSTA